VSQLLRQKVPVSQKLNVAQAINTVIHRLRLLKDSTLDDAGVREYLKGVQAEAHALRPLVLAPSQQ
jgi:hypothetical protein